MKTSQTRILTTHVGSLPRGDTVLEFLEDRESRHAYDTAAFDRSIRQAVLDIVKRQADVGIDIVSDGETSKISYATYVHDRLTGFSEEGDTEASRPHADLGAVSRSAARRWRSSPAPDVSSASPASARSPSKAVRG